MARIKIKCRLKTNDKKSKRIEIPCIRDIGVRRIFTANDGCPMSNTNESHADGIFNNETKHEPVTHDLVPPMPPEPKT